MKFIKEHEQPLFKEVLNLIGGHTFLNLISSNENKPRLGLYNFFLKDNVFYIHIGKKDEQLLDLKVNPTALITFADILSVIPSHWIDKRYGGAINNFFRYAEFQCSASLLETPKEILPVLKEMLELYQLEKDYDPLDTESEVYEEKFAMLTVVALKVVTFRTKWNLGQTKPRTAFHNIISELEKRKIGKDLETAMEMRKLNLESFA